MFGNGRNDIRDIYQPFLSRKSLLRKQKENIGGFDV